MAQGNYYADAVCPHYRRDDGFSKISCEGIAFTQDCRVILYFDDKQDFQTHIRTFCCDRYQNCEIRNAIMEAKYAEEDEE